MLHYINMPTKDWWEHQRNYRPELRHPRISESEEITAERFRQEYEANETRKMMEAHNDIRAIS